MFAKFAVYYASLIFLWSVARLYPGKTVTHSLPHGVTERGPLHTEDSGRMTVCFSPSDLPNSRRA